MMIDASNREQVVERLDELARMLEHGEFKRATEFARDLHREAFLHLSEEASHARMFFARAGLGR